jgi:hypothetical protein
MAACTERIVYFPAVLWSFAALLLLFESAECSVIPPQDLGPNEPYHLVFISSALTTTRSHDIDYYNGFVTSVAISAGIASSARIIGSTRGGVSAYENTAALFANHSSVPIYNTLGERVADSFSDLWDGSLHNAVKADELGNDLGNRGVATGTSWDGSASWNPLGPKLGSYGVETGRAGETSAAWLETSGLTPSRYSVPVYGITQELRTPPDPRVTVRLFSGFNMIAIPEDVRGRPALEEWVSDLGDASEIASVQIFDIDSSSLVTLIPDDPSNPSINLSGGEALIVRARAEKVVRFNSPFCSAHDFGEGFNLVGFACPSEGYSAFRLLRDIGDGAVSSISRYSTTTSRFETAAFYRGMAVGQDFPIRAGEGYIVFSKQPVIGFREDSAVR